MLRHQAGQNFGRTFTATLNYGTMRIPAEPLETRRQDNIKVVDFRAGEGDSRLDRCCTVAPFIDLYNVFNANAVQNLDVELGIVVPATHEHRSAARGAHRREGELVNNAAAHTNLRT